MARNSLLDLNAGDQSKPTTDPSPTPLWLSIQPSAQEIKACTSQPGTSFKTGNHVLTEGHVEAKGKSKIVASGDATAIAREKASLDASDNAVVCALDQTTLGLAGHSTGFVQDRANVMVTLDQANVFARGRGDIHNHAQGTVVATDQRDVYLRSGTAWVSGDAAVEPSLSTPGDLVKAFAKDHAIVATYNASKANESPPEIKLQDQAIRLDYDYGKQTLSITQADGTSRVVPAAPDTTIWVRDSVASQHNHKKAGGDDVVVRVRGQSENKGYNKPPAKLTGNALWIDIWPNGSTLTFNRAEDVHYKNQLQLTAIKIAGEPKHLIDKAVKGLKKI
jgi:hypothetical protein